MMYEQVSCHISSRVAVPLEQLPGDFVERLTAAMIWLAKYYGPAVRYCFCGKKLGRHGNARHPGSAVKTVRDIRKATR